MKQIAITGPLLAAILLLASLTAGGASSNDVAVVNLEPVFGQRIRLFNGESLAGWRSHFRDGSTDSARAWIVEDGNLVCKGQPIGYLQTEMEFENYELVVEWRFDPTKGAGNSGVLLRTIGEDTVWPNCIEAQLHSRNAGDIWNIGDFPMQADASRTKGRRTIKAHETNEKPLGEWNRYRIRLDRGNLTLEVNGLVQNEAKDCRELPGRIGLQSEGAHIEFRTVELRPIIGWTANPR